MTGGLVRADDLAGARALMASALSELASHPSVTMELVGTYTDDGQPTALYTTLTFSIETISDVPVVRLEMIESVGGSIVSRTVADGTRLWTYDAIRNTYRSSNYAGESYTGKERDRLFKLMALRSRDDLTLFARLLDETYGASAAQVATAWRPWRPNSTVGVSGTSVVCASGQPFNNQLTYLIEAIQGGGYRLLGADYYEESLISERVRTTQWQISIVSYDVPQEVSFEFVPPEGARAVSTGGSGG